MAKEVVLMKVTLKQIEKSFGSNHVLKNINLEIQSEQFTTLLGPSGCGKTTLLRIISGLEQADHGEIYFDDQCVYSSEKGIHVPAEKRNLGFVFQDFALWPHMTVFENVAFGLRAKKQTAQLKEKVEIALLAVHLQDYSKRYPHELSGGQQQRVAFARAIVMSPRCILFDEPLSALDAILREEMRLEIKRLTLKMKATSIFVTHDQKEAMMLSDKIVVMKEGEILQIGKPEEIYHHPQSIFTAGFIGEGNWLNEKEMIRVEDVSLEPIENGTLYSMVVVGCQFMGNGYEVLLEKEQHQWVLHTKQRYALQEHIDVYIDRSKLYSF